MFRMSLIFLMLYFGDVRSEYISDFILLNDSNFLADHEEEIQNRDDLLVSRDVWNTFIQYKGILGTINLERGIFNHLSIGFGLGQFNGQSSINNKNGVIPYLYHSQLSLSIYLNSEQMYFQTGGFLKTSLHASYLQNNSFVYSVNVDNKEIITRGNFKLGPSFIAGYLWSIDQINLSLGIEYFSLGALKSIIPLSATLGYRF